MGPDDWPTLRHDGRRSSSTVSAAPTELKKLWEAPVGSGLSSPVVAAGRLFISTGNAHAVTALNAADGKTAWTFTTGARIDSPPTFHQGRLIFGSSDGWVYCLDAADGKLAWRFLAAPEDRRIVVREQVESVWPVHGGTLVENGVAYFWAGRHTLCDGGLWAYALDVKTGQVLWQRRFTRIDGGDMATVPLTDGKSLRLGMKWRLNLRTGDSVNDVGMMVWCWSGLTADTADPRAEESYVYFRRQWAFTSQAAKHIGTYVDKSKAVRGQILAYDDSGVYGVRQVQAIDKSVAFRATLDGALQKPGAFGKESGSAMLEGDKWAVEMPSLKKVSLKAVVVARDRMLVGGSVIAGERKGQGRLLVLATEDGKRLAELDLPLAPRWDGLAVAGGKVFVCAESGSVMCFAQE